MSKISEVSKKYIGTQIPMLTVSMAILHFLDYMGLYI